MGTRSEVKELSVNNQTVTISGFVSYVVSAAITHLFCRSTKGATDDVKLNGYDFVPINLYLQMQARFDPQVIIC